ncbi:MAG: hypothetical protein A2177_02100 [Spirochaetes bacterium RBG_13_68_11]|nr:MAG: hypothetical protein A2177_02100 [Spirochaetes bacterium RBG_13_68_11]
MHDSMNDSSNVTVGRNALARQGVQGVVFVAGGIILMLAARGGVFGIVVGALAAIAGLALTGSKADRNAAIIALVAGLATLLAGIFSSHLAWLLWIMRAAGLVLAGVGGYWIWKLIANLRKRM